MMLTMLDRCGPIVLFDLIESAFCDGLIRFFYADNAINGIKQRTFNGIPQYDKRLAEFVFLSPQDHHQLCRLFGDRAAPILGLGDVIAGYEQSVIYRYPPGPGFILHHDEVTEIERQNAKNTGAPIIGGDITISLCINSPKDYEGGAVVFPDFGISFKLPARSLLIYPAKRTYRHRVDPITKGERFTAVLKGFLKERS